DADDTLGGLAITVTLLPTNGTVTLADGTTAVALGQVLTAAQLSGLKFAAGATGSASSNFGYTVTDAAGNAAGGSATLNVAGTLVSLFDFVFTYNDGKDYYYGVVADNGLFGTQVGQKITTAAGHYDVYNQEGLPSTNPAG